MILTNKESITQKRIAMTQVSLVIISWGDRKIFTNFLNYLIYLISPYKGRMTFHAKWLPPHLPSCLKAHDFHPKRFSSHFSPAPLLGSARLSCKATSRGLHALLCATICKFSKKIFFIFRLPLIYYHFESKIIINIIAEKYRNSEKILFCIILF